MDTPGIATLDKLRAITMLLKGLNDSYNSRYKQSKHLTLYSADHKPQLIGHIYWNQMMKTRALLIWVTEHNTNVVNDLQEVAFVAARTIKVKHLDFVIEQDLSKQEEQNIHTEVNDYIRLNYQVQSGHRVLVSYTTYDPKTGKPKRV
jgi:hypothetical protein